MKTASKNSQSGFSIVAIVVAVIAIVAVLAVVTMYLPKNSQQSPDYAVNLKDIGNNQIELTDKVRNFSLVYPKDWSRQDTNVPESKGPDGSVYQVYPVLRPPVTQNVDQGTGTINIVTGQEKTNYNSFDDFISNQVGWVSQSQDYKVVSSEKTTLSGLPAYKIIFTATVQGQSVKLMQVYALKGSTSYAFTYRISPENYSTYENTANQILSSIQIN